MKRILWICSLFIVTLSACKKDSVDQAAVDDAAIQTYLKANNIVATKDPSGVYYSVITPGTGAYPTATSVVNVNYRGIFTNGNEFDKGTLTNITVGNSGLVAGFQTGLDKINKGGRLLLLIPSALGYGKNGQDKVPGNTVIIFTIDMLSIR